MRGAYLTSIWFHPLSGQFRKVEFKRDPLQALRRMMAASFLTAWFLVGVLGPLVLALRN